LCYPNLIPPASSGEQHLPGDDPEWSGELCWKKPLHKTPEKDHDLGSERIASRTGEIVQV
jgi:hypothetical protein